MQVDNVLWCKASFCMQKVFCGVKASFCMKIVFCGVKFFVCR